MINLLNYETFFLLYADGELSPAEQESVLEFLRQHPLLEEEFNLIGSLVLNPEKDLVKMDKSILKKEILEDLDTLYDFEPDLGIICPNKSVLYKKERVATVYRFRMFSAAAAILFTACILWLVMGEKKQDTSLVHQAIPVQQEKQLSSNPEVDVVLAIAVQKNNSQNTMGIQQAKHQSSRASEIAAVAASTFIASTTVVTAAALPDVQKENIGPQTIENVVQDLHAIDASKASIVDGSAKSSAKENLSEAALMAASERIVQDLIPQMAPSELNTAMLLNSVLKEEKKSVFRSIVRTIKRRLMDEKEVSPDQKFIQVANFYIPVNK